MKNPAVEAPAETRRVSIFGATGSVGRSTLDVLREHKDCYDVVALCAQKSAKELASAAIEMNAETAVLADQSELEKLRQLLKGTGIEAQAGRNAVLEAASRPCELFVSAIVGTAGLEPTIAAIDQGADIALANKECLVCAGEWMMRRAEQKGATILPVDSEHNAIFQAIQGSRKEDVERLTLTASGGPFRTWPVTRMKAVTPEEAVAHPNWSMGAKISVDSATMMNKALEVIEAYHLFGVAEEKIDVVVHPESIVHSLVTFCDSSTIAQLSNPDMRVPIAHAFGWPHRIPYKARKLDLAMLGQLTFAKPDCQKFPSMRLVREVLHEGGSAPIVFNAANEVGVAAFLERRIGFLDIVTMIERVLNKAEFTSTDGLEHIKAQDIEARMHAKELIACQA